MKAITNEIGDIYSVHQGIPILFNVIKTKRQKKRKLNALMENLNFEKEFFYLHNSSL